MRHDETRDNVTDIEATIIEADKRAREESAPYPPAYPFPVFGAEGDMTPVDMDNPREGVWQLTDADINDNCQAEDDEDEIDWRDDWHESPVDFGNLLW